MRVSNLFEKFQYDFKRKIGGRNSDVAFGTGWFSVPLAVLLNRFLYDHLRSFHCISNFNEINFII